MKFGYSWPVTIKRDTDPTIKKKENLNLSEEGKRKLLSLNLSQEGTQLYDRKIEDDTWMEKYPAASSNVDQDSLCGRKMFENLEGKLSASTSQKKEEEVSERR